MKLPIVVPILLTYAFAAAAGAFAASVPTSDQQFMQKAYQGGYAEVVLGKLAMQKGASSVSKAYGQRMVSDHSTNINQLAKLAQSDGVTVKQALPADAVLEEAKLKLLSGGAFDKEYISYEASDHLKDLSDYQHELASTKNAALKQYVAQTIPVLQAHESLARQDAPKVGAQLSAAPSP